MRASDADRDRVIDVLRGAAADGRLTAEEFEERMTAALASRTHGELAVLTADLVASRPAPSTGETVLAQEVARIDQRGGTVQRTGRWVVPRRLELRSSWSDVTLDFTEAIITADTLVIEMNVRGGSVILVAGPGILVDVDALMVRYTDVEVRSDAGPGTPVVLRVRLTGRMRYGYVGTR